MKAPASLGIAPALLSLVLVAFQPPPADSRDTAAEPVTTPQQAELSTRDVPIISVDGLRFRDLDRSGDLQAYEDWRETPTKRAADLLQRMTLAEKLGQLAHGNILPEGPFGAPATGYNLPMLEGSILQGHITAYIPFVSLNFREFAAQNNAVQEIAERGRLGIPVTISTDPRHHFMASIGASTAGEGFSQWPEPLGFAALNDEALLERFAAIAAREYRATGFVQALSPQADLATEPRWTRIHHTFGEDAETVGRMVGAYIRGFQGGADGVRPGAVTTVVKHWVGYGAARDGLDSHNYYGRFADLASEDFETHLSPFRSAFSAGVAGVMPAYSIFEGLTVGGRAVEPRGAAYSDVLIRDLLRSQQGYDGFVLSDWAVTQDCPAVCRDGRPEGSYPNPQAEVSTAWGVLDLSKAERFALAMSVGVDQFGGVGDVRPIIEAVEEKLITESRVDESVLRILRKTFATGLFEAPFVDETRLDERVNTPEVQALALETQARATVLLNTRLDGPPLRGGVEKVYLYGAEPAAFTASGYDVVTDMASADIAILRLKAPYETLHPNHFFGAQQHEGSLEFDPQGEEMQLLRALRAAQVTTVVDVALDRPAILTDVLPLADVLLANFGASTEAILSVLEGRIRPEGRLPLELPSSMEAVEAQDSGRPADSVEPLFPLHYAVQLGAQ